MNTDFEYRDIFDEGGIKIVKAKNGRYRWIIDSQTDFRTPMSALQDALKVIGQPDREEPEDIEIELPWFRDEVAENRKKMEMEVLHLG